MFLFLTPVLLLLLVACNDEGAENDGDGELEGILARPVDETMLLEALQEKAIVAWDEYGIPHVYAHSERDAIVIVVGPACAWSTK